MKIVSSNRMRSGLAASVLLLNVFVLLNAPVCALPTGGNALRSTSQKENENSDTSFGVDGNGDGRYLNQHQGGGGGGGHLVKDSRLSSPHHQQEQQGHVSSSTTSGTASSNHHKTATTTTNKKRNQTHPAGAAGNEAAASNSFSGGSAHQHSNRIPPPLTAHAEMASEEVESTKKAPRGGELRGSFNSETYQNQATSSTVVAEDIVVTSQQVVAAAGGGKDPASCLDSKKGEILLEVQSFVLEDKMGFAIIGRDFNGGFDNILNAPKTTKIYEQQMIENGKPYRERFPGVDWNCECYIFWLYDTADKPEDIGFKNGGYVDAKFRGTEVFKVVGNQVVCNSMIYCGKIDETQSTGYKIETGTFTFDTKGIWAATAGCKV